MRVELLLVEFPLTRQPHTETLLPVLNIDGVVNEGAGGKVRDELILGVLDHRDRTDRPDLSVQNLTNFNVLTWQKAARADAHAERLLTFPQGS
jgi:hypothetical protein